MAKEVWRKNLGNGWNKTEYRNGGNRYSQDKGTYREHRYNDGTRAYTERRGDWIKRTNKDGSTSWGRSAGQGYTKWSDGTLTRSKWR